MAARKRAAKQTDERSFEFVGDGSGEPGRFQCYDADGAEVVVESGSTFSTADQRVAAYLASADCPWVKEV